jgi:hypothetical protein
MNDASGELMFTGLLGFVSFFRRIRLDLRDFMDTGGILLGANLTKVDCWPIRYY